MIEEDDESGEADVSKLKPLTMPAGMVVETPLSEGLSLIEYVNTPPAAVNVAEVEKGATLTDRVLLDVRIRRHVQDDAEGFVRDYADGTCGTRFHGPAATTDRQVVLEARRAHDDALRAARLSWRHKLEVATAELYAESDPKKLRSRIIEVAAVAVSWAEGLEVRASGQRIAAEQRLLKMVVGPDGSKKFVQLRPPWWQRLASWLGLR